MGSLVYINEWQTDNILRVDKATGNVVTLIDGSALLTAAEKQNANVLNGIAYDEAKRRFYLTGKYWPKLFEVSFDFDPGSAGDAGVDAGIVDAGVVDTGGNVDVMPPRDASRDAASDNTTVDVPRREIPDPRAMGPMAVRAMSRRATRGGPTPALRRAMLRDLRTAAMVRAALRVQVVPVVSVVPVAGGTGDAGAAGDTGGGPTQEGCACRAGGAQSRGAVPALALLLGAILAGRARRNSRRG